MELLVALIIVLGLAAVAARFLVRSGGPTVELPRIVDDSIGMYLLRRITGRPLGDRRLPPPIAAGPSAAVARPFSAVTAKRLGIPRASDLVPPRAGAGAVVPAPTSAGSAAAAPRRRLGPLALGLLAMAAIVAGLAIGAGLALLVPGNGAVGGTGAATAPASQPAPAGGGSTAPAGGGSTAP